jgi:hypothetical protein
MVRIALRFAASRPSSVKQPTASTSSQTGIMRSQKGYARGTSIPELIGVAQAL